MKLKDIIKKQTLIIVLTVAIVTISTISVSYAVFFDVKKNSEDQVITAGTLTATITNPSGIAPTEVLPDAEGIISTPLTYTIDNTGSLPVHYRLCVFAAPGNTIPLDKFKISTDGTTYKNLVQTSPSNKNAAAEAEIGAKYSGLADKSCYIIAEENVKARSNPAVAEPQNRSIRIWVSSELYADGADGQVNIELHFDTEVDETTPAS